MTKFRRAALEALDEIGHDAAVARARRRVAARLEVGEVRERTWLTRWAPVLATAALAASVAIGYAVLDDGEPEVLAVPTPEEEPEELPPEDGSRPGMAPKAKIPPVERMPIPEAPRFSDDEQDAEDPQADDREGTLVAIAIGGTCTFFVDGEPKGTSSSIRVTTSVGEHVVGCKVGNGEPRLQRVRVKQGKPGIASFRIN